MIKHNPALLEVYCSIMRKDPLLSDTGLLRLALYVFT
jgi:hypothetical protein